MLKKLVIFISVLILCLSVTAYASETDAVELTETSTFTGTGYDSVAFLKDGNSKSYKTSSGSATITITNAEGIGSLYLMFDLEYGTYVITDAETGEQFTAGQYEMLHEYVDLYAKWGHAPKSVTVSFENGKVRLSEIRVFSPGAAPSDVQTWQPPLEGKTDLLLLATHGDDDQLFFAGLLPHYAGEVGAAVQVAYLTDHRNLTNARTHEMLNGLWAVGVTAYPVFADFADFRIDSLQGTYDEYARLGTTKTELLEYVVTQIRRFKPQVIVGHDVNGEYGHGMHMVYTDLLKQALDVVQDAAQFPETAEKYGVWVVPKTYLHLYKENPIVLDYDRPLEHFDGMTAFEVTQKLGYPCHLSQQYTWFTDWINGKNAPITKATEIQTYNPCNFGLYRSTVGADVNKNDFLENIITYAEQERLEQERLEQERLEQERLEQERLEQERLEQLRQEQEEQQRLEEQKQSQEQTQQSANREAKARKLAIAASILIILVIALFCVIRKLFAPKR